MDIAALQKLEAVGAHAQIERQLAGIDAHHSAQLLQYAAQYYARRKKPLQSMQYYARYLRATPANVHDLDAVVMAIDCAQRIGNHNLVIACFQALSLAEREKLPSEALIVVARAMVGLGKVDEAEELAALVRTRAGKPALPDFASYIRATFGDAAAVRQFIAEHAPRFDCADAPDSIRQAMALALAYMAEQNYPNAIAVLERCKAALVG